MIKTKQELLNHFSDINTMYNNPFMYQTLSNMIDELLEQQPCEDEPFTIAEVSPEMRKLMEEWQQPCEDAVSREKINYILHSMGVKNAYDMPSFWANKGKDYKVIPTQWHKGYQQAIADMEKQFNALPSVQPQQKIGHNCNEDYADCDQFVCSECGIELQDWHRVERDIDDGDITYHEYTFKYCPDCGAKIGGGEE
jgi:hypothetical protein